MNWNEQKLNDYLSRKPKNMMNIKLKICLSKFAQNL